MRTILRRATVFLLTLALLLAAPAAGPAAHAAGGGFTDVADSYWGAAFVGFAAEAGIINGYPLPDGRRAFRPENPVTREESMQMVYKAAVNSGARPAPAPDQPAAYADLLATHGIAAWAYECVAFGLAEGILSEAELGGFRNDAGTPLPATRLEVARWAAKALDRTYLAATSLDFPDKDKIARTDLIYADLLHRMNIMVGDEQGRFHPDANIRRVEFAVICTRMYDLADAPFSIGREVRSFTGTVSGSSADAGRIFLSTAAGGARILDVESTAVFLLDGRPASRAQAFAGLSEGALVSIASDSFGQVHIQTRPVSGQGRVEAVEPQGGGILAVTLTLAGGTARYYFDPSSTAGPVPAAGQTLFFIADGVRLVETAGPV